MIMAPEPAIVAITGMIILIMFNVGLMGSAGGFWIVISSCLLIEMTLGDLLYKNRDIGLTFHLNI
jgi:hypothetical protein